MVVTTLMPQMGISCQADCYCSLESSWESGISDYFSPPVACPALSRTMKVSQ